MSRSLRACEAFQPLPTSCPLAGSLQASPEASPQQGEAGQPGREEPPRCSKCKQSPRGKPARSGNHSHNYCFRLTFSGVYYSFHSWPCLYYYYSFHVKEEILLLNHCLWSPLCTQLPRSARCWFAADELLA